VLVAHKKARMHWGPKELRAYLRPRHPKLDFPAPSTIGAILKAEGLVQSRRRRRAPLAPPVWDRERTAADAANRVWCIDFKRDFRLGSRQRCYPLTLVDLHSRAILTVKALNSTESAPVQEELSRVFERYGLPEVIRSDQGTPFATTALARLSTLAIWWIKLGIRLELNDRGRPAQNGALSACTGR
jgi:transposase InsO family protein